MGSVLRLPESKNRTEPKISVLENREPKFSVSIRLGSDSRFFLFGPRFSVFSCPGRIVPGKIALIAALMLRSSSVMMSFGAAPFISFKKVSYTHMYDSIFSFGINAAANVTHDLWWFTPVKGVNTSPYRFDQYVESKETTSPKSE